MKFARLLEQVAQISPLRVRFSTSHPKDIIDEVLQIIASYEKNPVTISICRFRVDQPVLCV
jgi:tRNA A37 methylthiotransferase MiaB